MGTKSGGASPNPKSRLILNKLFIPGSSSAGVQKSSVGVEILYILSGCVYISIKILSIYALSLMRSKYILSI